MSLGWKKFSFFDQESRTGTDVPAQAVCSCSNRQYAVFGVQGGQVLVLDRALQLVRSFQAHAGAVKHVQLIEEGGSCLLLSVGAEHKTPPLASALKFWDLPALSAAAAAPTVAPAPLCTVKLFGPKQPEVDTSAVCAKAEKLPSVRVAVGLTSGQVLAFQGPSQGKDRMQRQLLSITDASADACPVTGLAYHGSGEDACLFALTEKQTWVFRLKAGSKALLDELGCLAGCSTLSPAGDLVVARSEAVYLYSPDGRGPCFVVEGDKSYVGWLGHSTVLSLQRGQQCSLQLLDLRNKLIAYILPLTQEVQHVLPVPGGPLLVVLQDGSVVALRERSLQAKLELLFSKHLYTVALNLARTEQAQASAEVIAGIQRCYADHFYAKHDFDSAILHYKATIGQLEASYVIRKFLDAQRIHHLTAYLEELHSQTCKGAGALIVSMRATQRQATSDHTTLLLNCYSKLKDLPKLEAFLRGSEVVGEDARLPFDTEVAMKVCRAAGLSEQALYVAEVAKEPMWYLEILVDDCQLYDDALDYLAKLPRAQAGAGVKAFGQVLVKERTTQALGLLMKLCTPGEAGQPDADHLADVSEFAALFSYNPQALMLLCEFILQTLREPPAEQVIYHTLLQLCLVEQLSDEQLASPEAVQASKTSRRQKALELLEQGWLPGQEARYDTDHALVLCRMHAFTPGLLFLYQRLRLFREVLHEHMAVGDHAAVIAAAQQLGDVTRGGDAQLWTEVLQYFGSQDWDCSAQVQEVLGHIEAADLLPPLVVLQALAKNPHLTLAVVKVYIERQLTQAAIHIDADKAETARYQTETAAMRAEVATLRSQVSHQLLAADKHLAGTVQLPKAGMPLELPAVHFMCGHSFNRAALGDFERECPMCADEFRQISDVRRSLLAGASEQDKFFTQLKTSADGFRVVADFFGRGLLNATAASGANPAAV